VCLGVADLYGSRGTSFGKLMDRVPTPSSCEMINVCERVETTNLSVHRRYRWFVHAFNSMDFIGSRVFACTLFARVRVGRYDSCEGYVCRCNGAPPRTMLHRPCCSTSTLASHVFVCFKSSCDISENVLQHIRDPVTFNDLLSSSWRYTVVIRYCKSRKE